VEWVCSVETLDSNGFGVDIALMESVLEEALAEIDDKLLNDMDYFENRQPSLENLGLYLEEKLRCELVGRDPELHLLGSSIQIWESQTAWARFSMSV
jgi:6-pyruvoyl-tetrahydropterin synthase